MEIDLFISVVTLNALKHLVMQMAPFSCMELWAEVLPSTGIVAVSAWGWVGQVVSPVCLQKASAGAQGGSFSDLKELYKWRKRNQRVSPFIWVLQIIMVCFQVVKREKSYQSNGALARLCAPRFCHPKGVCHCLGLCWAGTNTEDCKEIEYAKGRA